MATKTSKLEVLLVQDALGKLYAVPSDLAESYRLSDKQAAKLLKVAKKAGSTLSAELEKSGFVRKLAQEELPNFRLLMQTEYKS